MAKVSGSYESVIKGVSQQVPQDRRSGQHFEQVNMISDVVRGLCRRRGSVWEHELSFGNVTNENASLLDIKSFRSFDFVCNNVKHTLFYRTRAKVAGTDVPFAFCFNKETRQFIPCVFDSDALVLDLRNGGASAIVNVGRYVYMAGNTITANYTQSSPWINEDNSGKGAIWIREGAYSRKYKATLRIKNVSTSVITEVVGEYTTKAEAYPGILDTSAILTADPDYQKKINDINSAYQTAFNQWIGIAAADVVPTNIAIQLKNALLVALAASAVSGNVILSISNSTLGVNCDPGYVIEEIVTSDAADETHLRAVDNEIYDIKDLSAEHFPNKIVKIRAKKADKSDAYYVIGTPKTPSADPNTLCLVQWNETAGVVVQPQDVFVFATVEAGTMYFSGSALGLKTLSGMTDAVPGFVPNAVGDLITNPIPYYYGRKINFLGVFQDRLIIGAKSTLSFSKPGQYLNQFRGTVLTVADNDPVEVFSLGSEDDVIVSSCTFDKNTILFGKRKQYMLNGRQPLTPKTVAVTSLSSYEDATYSVPISSSNYVFYSKFRNGVGSMHQLQVSNVQDSPSSYETSSPLSDYLEGKPAEMLAVTTPNVVMLRLEDRPKELFLYTYFDESGDEKRLFDAWSRWTWDEQLGSLAGFTYSQGDLSVMTIRKSDDVTPKWYIVSDKFVFDTTLTDKPILDSMQPLTQVDTAGTKWLKASSTYSNTFVAFDNTIPEFMLGQSFADRATLAEGYSAQMAHAWVGFGCPAYVTPTNPYIRDKNDKAIINSRLTITRYLIRVDNTGGVQVTATTTGRGEYALADYSGRNIGRPSSTLGVQPIAAGTIPISVGKETQEFTYTIKSKTWLPLTITAIEWSGQFFYNARRV